MGMKLRSYMDQIDSIVKEVGGPDLSTNTKRYYVIVCSALKTMLATKIIDQNTYSNLFGLYRTQNTSVKSPAHELLNKIAAADRLKLKSQTTTTPVQQTAKPIVKPAVKPIGQQQTKPTVQVKRIPQQVSLWPQDNMCSLFDVD